MQKKLRLKDLFVQKVTKLLTIKLSLGFVL